MTRPLVSVVCRGFIPARGEIAIRRQGARALPRGARRRPARVPGPGGPILIRLRFVRGEGSPLSGMDSDLEAFSHYPADGSFAALPCRTAAKTNYPNPRFLSY